MARGKTTGGNGSNADGAKPRARKSAAAEGAGRGGSRGGGKSGAKSGAKGGASRRGGKAEEQGASTVRNTANRAAETVQQAASAATERTTGALRDIGQKAADLANNPIARSMLAAGLVTAAAALTANTKARQNARKAGLRSCRCDGGRCGKCQQAWRRHRHGRH
jgi:hypothetical protein